MRGAILISFSETDEPDFTFVAGSDQETAALQEWVELILGGQPSGLIGGPILPRPAFPDGGNCEGKNSSAL